MKRILTSRVFTTGITLVSAAVLVVGIAAYIQSRPDPSPATNTETYGRDYELPETTKTYTAADLPKGVQKVAGEFILAAAGREDLAKAWKLTHPELRAQCGCTYKQWLTGDIPVQYYPSKDISTASFEVERHHAEGGLPPRAAPAEGQLGGQAAGLRHRAQDAGDRREEAVARELLGREGRDPGAGDAGRLVIFTGPNFVSSYV